MLNSHPSPRALGLPANEIERITENIRTQVNFNPGDDLNDLVKKLGGEIHYSNAWSNDNQSGSILIEQGIDGKNKFEIFLSLDTSVLRDRFTIAHEIGHYILHFLYRNQVLNENITSLEAARYGNDRAENEANWFAAAFLMPREEFIKKYSEFSSNHYLLSDYFKVSRQASEVRAKVLRLE